MQIRPTNYKRKHIVLQWNDIAFSGIALGIPAGSIHARLMKAGKVRRVGRGRYRLLKRV
jgi:hypothetical protein